MMATIVDRLYTEFSDLIAYLDGKGEVSLRSVADENFRKSLLLAAASYFENRITNDILVFVDEASLKNQRVVELVKSKAISRKYHTFFNWDAANANQFFAIFGESFLNNMKAETADNAELDKAVKAFIELGRERNRLVHQDYGNVPLEKTTSEIYKLYETALSFVNVIPEKLRS
jgi:RiboL-PSP-HEPN